MSNKDTKESRIKTLKQTQKQRQENARNRVYKAIERLQKLNAKINFHSISREAQVSVSYLYKYPEIKQHIAELRSKQNSLPVNPVAKPNSTSGGKGVKLEKILLAKVISLSFKRVTKPINWYKVSKKSRKEIISHFQVIQGRRSVLNFIHVLHG